MATRVIDDTKLQNIAVAIQSKDNGGQMTVDEMTGRIEGIPSSSPIFEEILNRTVSGIVATNKVKYLLTQMFCEMPSVTGIILNANPLFIGGPPLSRNPSRMFDECSNLKFAIMPHLTAERNNSFGEYVFSNCHNLKMVVLSTMGREPRGDVYNGANAIKQLVITNNTIIPLTSTNTFSRSAISKGTCNIYIPDILKENYKVATNWSTYANQFKGYSEAPDYDTNIIYTIGDLCKYNNKLYAWINETDGNSIPSGDVDEYGDWYCVANIEGAN